MGVIIGIDIGGSTTKIIGFHGEHLLKEAFVKASDPIASAYGGIGKFLENNKLALADIERIVLTGVGASYIDRSLLEHPTEKAPEFDAIGLGGLYCSPYENAIIVSMGTGTSIVCCDGETTEHIIGSGVGGGTLLGLSNRMINVRDFTLIANLAQHGDLSHVDLTVGDITSAQIPGLSMDTTASNFGKLSDAAQTEDIALGIVNLVFQSVGTAAVLAARLKNIKDIVFVGSLQRIEQGRRTLELFAELYKVNICIPENAEFATAIGAALTAIKSEKSK